MSRYPKEVHDFIRDNVAGRTAQELADVTNVAFGTDFTAASMKSYKNNHKLKSGTLRGIPKGRPTKLYPTEVIAYIREHYQGTGHAAMAEQLKEVFGRVYTAGQIKAYYARNKLDSGLTGHFEKDHIPFNKGVKGYIAPGCEKGWFKKGGQPWDTVPVGTVVVKTDGYLWKKIDDKPGVWLQNWKQLHLLIWEEAHGPVPEGHRVIFKDGDRQNCTLENLALVTLAENAVLNRCSLRFGCAEHTETGILIAKVKIAAGRHKNRRNGRERKSNPGDHQGAGDGTQSGADV